MGRSAKFYKKNPSKTRSSAAVRAKESKPEADTKSQFVNAHATPSRKGGGMRFKARRTADGPLPAESGIDYVGLWAGDRHSVKDARNKK
ncbi:uncharacterized protein MRET_1778 [Malassezia restricta]|uniref:uncharacterized protein n=1 Tax=Malassezia restricta TaxID=76775 RepID=UPI000DD13FAA|nr:uncharacterized protein MRET_1778 [Malassezia restricta]AXA50048.1 uncharacterized protein MRET_1778 [Malassezia restricta]